MGAEVPGGLGVASTIAHEKTNWATPGLVVVSPGFRIFPFDTATKSLQPLPEEVGGVVDFFVADDVGDDHKAMLM